MEGRKRHVIHNQNYDMSESEMKPNWAGHQQKPAPCWQNDWYHKHSMQTYWDIWKFNV